MTGRPSVAVIVVARNEAALIGRCIASLAAQTRPADKVILVDDGSTDDTIALARAALPSIEILSRHTRSLARNRNAGWQGAGTDYVAYLDADCEAPPHWLATLTDEAFRTGADAVGGGNRPPTDEGPHFEALGIMLGGFLGSRGSIQGAVPSERRTVIHLPTLNVMYRTAALESVGGFDADFAQIGEDEDLSRRMGAIGCRFVATPDATVIHRQRPDIASWARNMFKYGKGRTWLLRRHPNAWSPIFLLPPLLWLILPLYLPAMAMIALWKAAAARRPALAPRLLALFVATHLPYAAGQVRALFQSPVSDRRKRRRVAVLALKNAGNKGDEAIMRCVCARLTRLDADVDIYLGAFGPSGFDIRPLPARSDGLDAMILDQLGPSATARKVRPAALLLDTMRCFLTFMRFDNMFIGGGQWLHDLSLPRHAAICLLFGVGRLFRTRTGVFCVGVGPLNRALSRRLVRLAFGRDALMITRDAHSSALLQQCGMANVLTATDPVIEMVSVPRTRDARRALISPCAWTSFANLYDRDVDALGHTVQSLAAIVRGLRQRGRHVAFLPTMNPEDLEISRQVSQLCGGVEILDTDRMTPPQVQEEIAGAGLLFTMRLHPLIFASNVGTTAITMDYAAKVRAFGRQAGIEPWLLRLDEPSWARTVLHEIDAADASAYQAAIAASRPALMNILESAYSTLSSWLSEYEHASEPVRQTDGNANAHRLC